MRALVLAAALFACSAPASDATNGAPYTTVDSDTGAYHLEVRTAPNQPPVHGVLTVNLTITDAKTTAPILGAAITVTPWMASHAHGTSVAPTVTETGQGRYRADNVDLYMPGSWQLRITIGGAVVDNATCTLDVR